MFTIEVDDQELTERLATLYARANDLTPLMGKISETLKAGVDRAFDTQTAPDGNPWKELSALTVMLRGVSGPILDRGTPGGLVSSLQTEHGKDYAQVGTNKEYALIHQLGGTIRPRKGKYLKVGKPGGPWTNLKQVTIPARPFLGLSDETRQDVLHDLTEYLLPP